MGFYGFVYGFLYFYDLLFVALSPFCFVFLFLCLYLGCAGFVWICLSGFVFIGKAGTWELQCWFFFFFFFGSYIWDLENWVGLFVLRNCWIFYVFRVQCWINWKCKLSVWWKTNKWAMCDLLTEMTLISFSIYNGYWVLRSILFV